MHGEECKNYNVLSGHTNAVLDLKWTPDGKKVRIRCDTRPRVKTRTYMHACGFGLVDV